MAVSTAVSASSPEGLILRKPSETTQIDQEDDNKNEKNDKRALEFAHCFPIHTKSGASILSKESTDGLSFRGFGNLACASSYPIEAYRSTCNGVWKSTAHGGKLC